MAKRYAGFAGITLISLVCVANGMEANRNKISFEQTYQDVAKELCDLGQQLVDIKYKKHLYNEVIKDKERKDGGVRVPVDLFARRYIRTLVFNTKQSVKNEKEMAFVSKTELNKQIEDNEKDCRALKEIISSSLELKGNVTKKWIAENCKLRALLYCLEESINQEEQLYLALITKLAVVLNSRPQPLFSTQVNMYTVEKENATLRLSIEEKNRLLDDIKRKNEELQSMIYGIEHGLLEYK